MQLAALGYQVVGIDLRDYRFTHPNFTFHQLNLLEFVDRKGFDYIVSVSTVEHIGLGAYGEKQGTRHLEDVVAKLIHLLRPGAKLIVTVPVGQEYQDGFLRSFTCGQIRSLFRSEDIALLDERYYLREHLKFWRPCDCRETRYMSNSKADTGPTGVNCVGCYVWRKHP
jgi:hypothetical protein